MSRYQTSFIITTAIYIATGLVLLLFFNQKIKIAGEKAVRISILRLHENSSIEKSLSCCCRKLNADNTQRPKAKQEEFIKNNHKMNVNKNMAGQQQKNINNSKSIANNQSQALNAISTKPQTDAGTIKDNFLAKIKNAINSNKYYPDMAKDRGIEGAVVVQFTITKNGNVTNITITSGNNLLRGAARDAIEKSFPQNIPKELSDQMPISTNITLNFNLTKE